MMYIGGKRRIALDIATLINNIGTLENISDYYEPFCGGCAVVEKVNIQNRYCSDMNHYLIALLKKIQGGVWDFEVVTEDVWRSVKNNPDNYEEWFVAYCGIICSFRGRWFAGYAPQMYTKASGEIVDLQIKGYNSLCRERKSLLGVHFNACDYAFNNIKKHSIVYCDAPYRNTIEYMTGKFDFKNYYNWLIELSKDNLVIISEYSMPKQFKEIDTFVLNGCIGGVVEDQPNECLYVVKGGWLVDKYFGDNNGLIDTL